MVINLPPPAVGGEADGILTGDYARHSGLSIPKIEVDVSKFFEEFDRWAGGVATTSWTRAAPWSIEYWV